MKKIIFCMLCMLLLLGSTITYASKYSEMDTTYEERLTYRAEMWVGDNGEIEYPITTNDKEWTSLKSHEEMVNACTIPTELLEKINTEELVDLMMDYPLINDLLLFDDIQTGFEVLSQESNILSELLKREDGAKKLLEKYSEFKVKKVSEIPQNVRNQFSNDPNVITDITKSNKCSNILKEETDNIAEDVFLETVLAQQETIKKLDENDLEFLTEVAEEKTDEKVKSNIFSSNYDSIIYDIAIEENTIDAIGELCIDNMIPSNNSSSVVANSNDIYVKTPKGTKVKVYQYEYSVFDALFATVAVAADYPNAKVKAPATKEYNCHSYAWYSQNVDKNKYWMNNPSAYFTDGSYTQTNTKNKGKKIVYYSEKQPIHSGIVNSVSGSTIKIISKWGEAPLMLHDVKYSPYGISYKYYKKN